VSRPWIVSSLRAVQLLAPPSRWVVTLRDRSAVVVWADSVEGLSGPDDSRDYRFENLMDIAPERQPDFEVEGRTPSDPRRVLVTVAVFPRAAVLDVRSS